MNKNEVFQNNEQSKPVLFGKPISGKQVVKAGKFLAFGDYKDEKEFHHCFRVLVWWRSEHSKALESAFKLLENIVAPIDKNALFAKRLKRYASIVMKLQRFDKMTLKTMQDIGGCRVVVTNEKKVQKIVRQLKQQSVFKRKNKQLRQKDYIETPKSDGYRSYHIIGDFKSFGNLNKAIEIQIRTLLQHYWATALEIIDLFTNQSLKTNQGRREWEVFFKLVGELFSYLDKISNYHNSEFQEKITRYLTKSSQNKSSEKCLNELREIVKKLDVFDLFSSFATSLKVIGAKLNEHEEAGYILIVIDRKKGQLEYTIFNQQDSNTAQELYAQKESEAASPENNLVVALVFTNSIEDVEAAYPNFFADSSEFLKHLNVLMEVSRVLGESSLRSSLSKWFRS